jgi:hypothetical protein
MGCGKRYRYRLVPGIQFGLFMTIWDVVRFLGMIEDMLGLSWAAEENQMNQKSVKEFWRE